MPLENHCNCCKHPRSRTVREFAHNHLQIVENVDPKDICMICQDEFGSIHPATRRKDVAVKVVGLQGCSHVYGLACLEYMWLNYAMKGARVVAGCNCMLDRTAWFSSSKSFTRPALSKDDKQWLANELNTNWEIDHAATARYFLFREVTFKNMVDPKALNKLQQRTELELCVLWAIKSSYAVCGTLSVLKGQQRWNLDDPVSDEEIIKHFHTKRDTWRADWSHKMDPFEWEDFTKLKIPHRARLVFAAMKTDKGRRLHSMVRDELEDCRKNSAGQLFDGQGEPWYILVQSAARVVSKMCQSYRDDCKPMFAYVSMVLLAAEFQQGRGVLLPNLPGMTDNMMLRLSWVHWPEIQSEHRLSGVKQR